MSIEILPVFWTPPKQTYSLGEVLELQINIINNTGKDVYFIKGLDGSEVKWRMPFCYFNIEKPVVDSPMDYIGRCGMMNSLKIEDFVKIESNTIFNPYGDYLPKYVFNNIGTYKITFHYSTKSNNITDYFGRGFEKDRTKRELKELEKLFNQVPKLELQSNTIEIEVIE